MVFSILYLLKRKSFDAVMIDFQNKNIPEHIVNRVFNILGEAKGIKHLKILHQLALPSSATIQRFASNSKTKHLTIRMNMFNFIAPYASLFQNIESIAISNFQFGVRLEIESINNFPKLNSFYNSDTFTQILETKDSINGAAVILTHTTPDLIVTKKFKTFVLTINYYPNFNSVVNLLLNSKETLENLLLILSTYFSFANDFFKNKKVLKHLIIRQTRDNVLLGIRLSNLNLLSLKYEIHHFDEKILDFVKTQTQLYAFTYTFAISWISMEKFFIFYAQMCEIMRLNQNIKLLQLTLPTKISLQFLIKLTKQIGRTNFTLNSISADLIVNVDNNIPFDLI